MIFNTYCFDYRAVGFSLTLLTGLSNLAIASTQTPSAVTTAPRSSRLGVQLVSYCKAKAFAQAYNLPFLYRPFPKGNQLQLGHKEKQLTKADLKNFKKKIAINKHFTFPETINPDAGILYVVTLESPLKKLPKRSVPDRKQLRTELKEMLTPIMGTRDVFRPKNKLSVAVHVRTGGGYDSKYLYKIFPLKCPPLSYYTDQIRALWELLNKKPLYIHVFTDDKHPEKLVAKFKAELKELPITFATRLEGNAHNANVLDDMFAMAKFDCLIRPQSNFSQIAGALGNHFVTIMPTKASKKNGAFTISAIKISKKK